MRGKQEAFAGLALGTAVGLLVGRSNSPVTANVVSSLVALIATFFGLSSQRAGGVRALRIASSGFACPIDIFVALAARSHGWPTPSIQQQIASGTTAGHIPAEARSFVADSLEDMDEVCRPVMMNAGISIRVPALNCV